MAILTNSGRAAAAMAIKAQPIHMGWGTGLPEWENTPAAESTAATGLLNELGRRRAAQVTYCTPDPDGELIVPNGRFRISDVPTRYLYTRFAFDFNDAAGARIREVAIFVGTQAKPETPAGQDYITPFEVADPGLLLALEHIPGLDRSASVRQQFEFVIQF